MSFTSKEKPFTLEWFIVYSYILLGTFIMAVGFVFFISPYKLAPGGVYGIAILLHHLLGFPIGLTALSLDIPLALIGTKILGPRFGIKTVVGVLHVSVIEFRLAQYFLPYISHVCQGRFGIFWFYLRRC